MERCTSTESGTDDPRGQTPAHCFAFVQLALHWCLDWDWDCRTGKWIRVKQESESAVYRLSIRDHDLDTEYRLNEIILDLILVNLINCLLLIYFRTRMRRFIWNMTSSMQPYDDLCIRARHTVCLSTRRVHQRERGRILGRGLKPYSGDCPVILLDNMASLSVEEFIPGKQIKGMGMGMEWQMGQKSMDRPLVLAVDCHATSTKLDHHPHRIRVRMIAGVAELGAKSKEQK